MRLLFAAALLICLPATAFAQDKPAFAGPYAGPEAGVLIHGFRLGDDVSSRKYVGAGLAGGGFAGIMLPVSERLRQGVKWRSRPGAAPYAARKFSPSTNRRRAGDIA